MTSFVPHLPLSEQERIIFLCACCYLRYTPSYRYLVKMIAERSLSVAHSTIVKKQEIAKSADEVSITRQVPFR